MIDEEEKRKLEDAIDAVDRSRTKVEIAALQLVAMGLKDHEVVTKLRTLSSLARDIKNALLSLRTA